MCRRRLVLLQIWLVRLAALPSSSSSSSDSTWQHDAAGFGRLARLFLNNTKSRPSFFGQLALAQFANKTCSR